MNETKFEIEKYYEYIGDDDGQFTRGGFYKCSGIYPDGDYLFTGDDGEDWSFIGEEITNFKL